VRGVEWVSDLTGRSPIEVAYACDVDDCQPGANPAVVAYARSTGEHPELGWI
jgi:hypothetical protein